MSRISRWYNWLWSYGPGLFLAWMLFAPEAEEVKAFWRVARGITAERFVEAVVVGAAILALVHFATKRYPRLNHNAHLRIERMGVRVRPYVERARNMLAPPIGRAFMWVWRPIWRVLVSIGKFIWRGVVTIGRFVVFLVRPIVHRIPKRKPRPAPKITTTSSTPGNRFPNRFMNMNWIMIGLYGSAFLGMNEIMNRPGQSAGEWVVKVSFLALLLLMMGQAYRIVLIILLLECYLLWVSVTQGVQVGTVYMLMFAAAYMLWLGYKKHMSYLGRQPVAE